ncbi:hypothetical protein P3T76_003458 [Phytophthora citrophthora]|uniref:EF-hand domain-containing protein n=1 Tax=Phytophthora citrophthora TaxID=4793 RepID=A0AAD9GUP3_9STRA|nr:hypothetical protein P3T76_003458 [Phytophthora citrophthora]
MAAAAVKKLSRYCCSNCGGSELYLYCWKGCRHVQNIKVSACRFPVSMRKKPCSLNVDLLHLLTLQTFYTETKSIQQELNMLHATIYEQETRFREYELQMKEKQESLEFLVNQVKMLPSFYPMQSSDNLTSIPIGLPSWSLIAAKMVWRQFDGDQDGNLTSEELRQLKSQLRKNHENVDDTLPDYPPEPLAPRHFLKLYECGESAKLSDDLRALGILCGMSESIAESLSACDVALTRITMEAQQLQKERDNFQKEVEESQESCKCLVWCSIQVLTIYWRVQQRAKTRLREVFATSKQSLEDKARDVLRLQQKETENEHHLRVAEEKAHATSLSKAKRESSLAKHALLDLRALVDDQIAEKEKWQRYCWELEGRLHEATNTSHIKERDLWRVKGAKKEESRRNMLLYIEAHKGKRHFARGVEPTVDTSLESTL